MTPRLHGGTDALGHAPWDFSSNANACGPAPAALAAVQQACVRHYPDPAYADLKAALAHFHGVSPTRILLAASASECIQRLTAWCWRAGDRGFWTPPHAYGDYAHAAHAWGMERVTDPAQAQLAWLCEPSSPLGQTESALVVHALLDGSSRTVVLDCAYAPLRLKGQGVLDAAQSEQTWQLWSPNKALGMTGVRAAYAIAPLGADSAVVALDTLAPSWPIGVHGVAMLKAWTQADTQQWLAQSRLTLAHWLADLRALLQRHGWHCADSDTPYLCAQSPAPLDATALRRQGVKLRDATSFGLPGWWRLSAQAPDALNALDRALALAAVVTEDTP